MTTQTTQWTRTELKAYILLFCAHADYTETKAESDLIRSKVGIEAFEKVHAAFDRDNDYQRIQTIRENIEALGYSKTDLEALYEEIKAVFFADGDFDILEQNLFRGLKHLLG